MSHIQQVGTSPAHSHSPNRQEAATRRKKKTTSCLSLAKILTNKLLPPPPTRYFIAKKIYKKNSLFTRRNSGTNIPKRLRGTPGPRLFLGVVGGFNEGKESLPWLTFSHRVPLPLCYRVSFMHCKLLPSCLNRMQTLSVVRAYFKTELDHKP